MIRKLFFVFLLNILLGGFFAQKSFAECVLYVSSAGYEGKTCTWTYNASSTLGNCKNSISVSGSCPVFSSCSSVSTSANSLATSYCVAVSYSCVEQGRLSFNYYQCATQSEADSVACVNGGGRWEEQECKAPVDSTACDSYRVECESMGGKFEGNVTELSSTGCVSSCNMCGSEAQERYRKAIAMVCCRQGKAPPSSVTTCITDLPSPGMTFSSFDCGSQGGFDCECQAVDSTNSSSYQKYCIDQDWDDEESSSSGGGEEGSSSSAEDSSASESPYPEGCYECPWLDSILDTLKLTKWNTDDMVMCLQTPGLCPGLLGDTTGKFSVDSILLDYIQPLLDSSVAIDSAQLKVLSKLDTNMVKMLRNDTALQELDSASLERLKRIDASLDRVLENDSSTRRAVRDGFDDVGTALEAIAQDLGISTDSVIAHLDSILKGIPDSVLDSIVKYQAYANESIDSAIYGTGKGFSLVDSLIDSTVKYFSRAVALDSAWRNTWGDSTHATNELLRWLPNGFGYGLGYGDTASSTLRGDLDGIRGALDGIGEALGGLGNNDSIFAPGSYDVGDDPYADGEDDGRAIADSIRRASGWDDVSGLDVDSMYASALASADGALNEDSIDAVQDARFVQVLDSLNTALVASNDSLRRGLPDSLDVWADSVRAYAPFFMFDSLIYGTIGTHIPNTNSCPEDCGRSTVTIANIGLHAFTIDYGLCLPRAPLGNMNVFAFVRMIARIVTVVSCLMFVFRNVTSRS